MSANTIANPSHKAGEIMKIRKPTSSEVQRYLVRWEKQDNYRSQESSLRKLFQETYPLNNNLDEILVKVCTLNDFYSTNIFSPYKVAKHILRLNIDEALNNGDLSLIAKIAKVRMKKEKQWTFYSFATKYCSHHKPELFPIYDYYVDKVLTHFKKVDKFASFRNADLQNYEEYTKVLLEFQKNYNLSHYSLKEIDKYLWQLGKKHFPRRYKKKELAVNAIEMQKERE